jgi:thiamine biosynthesis protein ThiS
VDIPVKINGEPQSVPQGTTVAGLLRALGKEPRYLAVERNLELIPRSRHAECVLLSHDEIEIVTLVGGG